MMDNNILTSRVELVNMEFFAYHGCFSEEQIIGNKFLVTFSAETDTSKAGASDNLADALNYQELYNIIKDQMGIASHLLEHVALRILDSCFNAFPQITSAQVEISKLNPPIGGRVEASKVVIKKNFR